MKPLLPLMALAGALAPWIAVAGRQAPTPQAPAGYSLVWSDEFDRDGTPDPARWGYERGFVRNQEAQWYQPENARVENGLLVIEARRERHANPNYDATSTDWKRNREFAEYTSASLTTRSLHRWQYGRFEMRGRIDTRAGLWPAFWTVGVANPWPRNGEIDIMEYYRGLLLANVAWGSATPNRAVWADTKTPITSFGDGWSDAFHVWRMDWDAERIRLFVDDRLLNDVDLTRTINEDGSGFNPFHQPHHIILNLAIGGTSGGDPSATTFPARFEVDYVRIYARATDAAETAPAADCNRAPAEPIVHVPIPGNAFQAVPSPDGCWIFVSSTSGVAAERGIAVLRRSAGPVTQERFVPLPAGPTGMALSHDGAVLMAAAGTSVAFLDAKALASGQGDPVLGVMTDADTQGAIAAVVTADDRWLFVSEERSAAISVIDLAQARRTHFAPSARVGRIPVGRAPVGLAFSRDGRYLYATAQAAPPALGWPNTCRPEGTPPSTAPNHSQGVLHVIDVALATSDPAHAVVRSVPAGCNPVRVAASPTTDAVFVTARGDDNLLVFSADKLLADPPNALFAKVPVGTAPVGVAVIDDGRRVVVTNSNRFATGADDRQFLTVVDAFHTTAGASAVLGTIPAGAFPRELRLTADGRTLLLTNFTSKTLELIDLARVQLAPPRR